VVAHSSKMKVTKFIPIKCEKHKDTDDSLRDRILRKNCLSCTYEIVEVDENGLF